MLESQDGEGICYDTLPDHFHHLIQGILYDMNYLVLIKILFGCGKTSGKIDMDFLVGISRYNINLSKFNKFSCH